MSKNIYRVILKEETKQLVKIENVPKYNNREIERIFTEHTNNIE